MKRWHAIVKTAAFHDSIAAGTADGRRKYEAAIESIGVLDHSLDIKMAVHYGLFGVTIKLLCDDRQAAKWLPLVESADMLGCFALTELGHGSNVKGIQTRALYDIPSRTFVLNTPNEQAQKYWIGGAFKTARWTAAFAQLFIAGVGYGVHPFLVRIRQEDGTPVPGVTLADCGYKTGLNGVDNGRIWFDDVRVPLEHLLRRHAQVAPDGTYTTKFKSSDERFGASLASLSAGRICVTAASLMQTKVGLAIAVRYALNRRAFGPPGEEETRLLDYPSHQHRLIPPLASTIVLNVTFNQVKHLWHTLQIGKRLHLWTSAFKTHISWHALKTLQEMREACGGQGYKAENRIGVIKNSHDVALTYEGDNHILLQAVARIMLPEFLKGFKAGGKFEEHFAYLNDRQSMRKVDLGASDPCSAQYGLTVMRRREASAFAKLASEMQDKIRQGMSSLDSFNDCIISANEAAHAHTDLLIVDLLHKKISQLRARGDRDIANMLSLCGGLHVVWRIDNDPVFLRNGAVSQREAQRAHNVVMELSKQIRPHVLHLVDSFGFPPHLLAPIAFDYVAHNDRAHL